MRLDVRLVETGVLSSRSRAKRAVIERFVMVNGRIVTKPSYDVAYSDNITVREDIDRPGGYWKLKKIQEKMQLLKAGDRVLDIGSSAGGFLLYASEIASEVHGIEFSREFAGDLSAISQKHPNVTYEFADVFTSSQEPERYDVLLLDITAKILSSIKALIHVLPSLKRGGMLLQVLKSFQNKEREIITQQLSSMGLDIIEILEAEKKEAYLIAKKLC